MIPYSAGATNQNAMLSHSAVSVGDEVDFSSATVQNSRDYAIGVTIERGKLSNAIFCFYRKNI